MFSCCYQRKIQNFWVLLIRVFEFGWTAWWIKQIIVSIEMPWKSGLVTDQIQVQERPWKFPSSPAFLEGSSLSQLGLTPGKMGDHFRRCSMYSRYIYISYLSNSSSAVSSSKCAMHFKAMCLGMFGSAQIVGVAGVPGGLWGHYFLEALFAGLLVQLRLALSCLTFLTSEGWGCPHKIRPYFWGSFFGDASDFEFQVPGEHLRMAYQHCFNARSAMVCLWRDGWPDLENRIHVV